MKLQTAHAGERFLKTYVVRMGGGKSPKLARLGTLETLAPADQFTACLLSKDKERAHQLIKILAQEKLLNQFYNLAKFENLTVLLFERICELNLAEEATNLPLANNHNLFSALREAAALKTSTYTWLNQHFLALLDSLAHLARQVIWLKGIVLARTLYSQPQFRTSLDFDILISASNSKALLQRLLEAGFSPIGDNPGCCHQLGAGPTSSLSDLFLTPHNQYEPCHNVSLKKAGWPHIELKFDPLERGLKMKELGRFFADTESIQWQDRTFRVPSVIDHLLLELTHLHKHGFEGWHWLYDIHLLAGELSKSSDSWYEFIRRCKEEGIIASAWAGLCLTQDRLSTPIPSEVLLELQPRSKNVLAHYLTFTISPEFLWNSYSLPSLILNAAFTGDSTRKQTVLLASFFPTPAFISSYYAGGKKLSWWHYLWYLPLHWLVIILPAGVVRKTFGQILWKKQFLVEY